MTDIGGQTQFQQLSDILGQDVDVVPGSAVPRTLPANYVDLGETLIVGDRLVEDATFMPWYLVSTHYLSKIVKIRDRDRIAPIYSLYLQDYHWHFFVLHCPNEPGNPCLLVPSTQFQAFLQVLKSRADLDLKMPQNQEKVLYLLRFGYGEVTPRPRYMAHSAEADWVVKLRKPPAELKALIEDDLAQWEFASEKQKELWLDAWDWIKPLTALKAEISKEGRAKKFMKDREDELAKIRSYFDFPPEPNWPVLVSIDIEVADNDPSGPITEIGVAALDTMLLDARISGHRNEIWQLISAHHMRVTEYRSHVNTKYVDGCPDNFDFGFSEFIPEAGLTSWLQDTFGKFIREGHDVILVAHNIGSDLHFLSSRGIEVDSLCLGNVIARIDTQRLYEGFFQQRQSPSLQTMLSNLGIRSDNLHNAGNDAVYTMRALAAMATEGRKSVYV